MQTVEVCSR